MLNTLGRNLNLCFAKIKLTSTVDPPSSSSHHHHHHSAEDHSRPSPPPIFIKNFNSLFDPTTTASATPDFATAVASKRFFFSSPGRSNSIIDSSSSSSLSSTSSSPPPDGIVGGGVAIPTNSPDPYKDFRRSMQEMVEARGLHDVRESWDHLHELLTCYLSLNPKSTHKFILGAFADLLVSLMSSTSEPRSTLV